MFALIPLGIGLAVFVNGLADHRRRVAIAVVLLLVFVEQGAELAYFDKAELGREVTALAARIPADCDAFLYAAGSGDLFWRGQVTAMWAGIAGRKPTINGHSGNVPPDWVIVNAVAGDRRTLEEALAEWAAGHGLDVDKIAVIDAH